jgi:hypothetical protein
LTAQRLLERVSKKEKSDGDKKRQREALAAMSDDAKKEFILEQKQQKIQRLSLIRQKQESRIRAAEVLVASI